MEVPARSSGNNIDWPNEDFFGKIPTNEVNLGEKFGIFHDVHNDAESV